MAMYHFRIKSDKKPNGTKISAVQHVEYINREGTFAHDEHWKQTNKFGGNFITTAQMPNALDGLDALLYKTDEKYKEEVKAYDELVRGVNSKIFSLLTSARAMKKSVEDIKHRLEQPEYRNNILMVTHQILQANTHARKMLKRASDELDKAVDDLRNALFVKTIQEPQTSFKTQ